MAEILAVKNAVPLPQAMSVEVAKHEHDIAMNEASTHCAIPEILQPGSAH
jgi:xanthine dehydrogenase accessory factor